MKLFTVLMIALSVLMTSSVFAADGDEKKPKTEKKEKKAMPEELMKLKKELAAKVKAGDITKEQAKEQFQTAVKELKKKKPEAEKTEE